MARLHAENALPWLIISTACRRGSPPNGDAAGGQVGPSVRLASIWRATSSALARPGKSRPCKILRNAGVSVGPRTIDKTSTPRGRSSAHKASPRTKSNALEAP